MKKLAIGCGIVAAIAVVAVVGFGTWGVLKVRSAVSQFAELGKIPDIEREIRVKTVFAPPSSGELTASQVDRLVQIQKRVRDSLGANAARMQQT